MRFVQIVASAAALATTVVAGGGEYNKEPEAPEYEPPKYEPPKYEPPKYEPPKPQPPVYEPARNITKYTTVITTDYTTFCPVSCQSRITLTGGSAANSAKDPDYYPH